MLTHALPAKRRSRTLGQASAGDSYTGTVPEWNSVPEEAWQPWSETFERSREGIEVSGACPVCSRDDLHRWFDTSHLEPDEFFGDDWAGRGGQWQWCGTCGSYEHTSGFVPRWWVGSHGSDLPVDPEELMHDPDAIEQVRLGRF